MRLSFDPITARHQLEEVWFVVLSIYTERALNLLHLRRDLRERVRALAPAAPAARGRVGVVRDGDARRSPRVAGYVV